MWPSDFGLSVCALVIVPRPRQKSAKVFEIKELSLDFVCDDGTKIESPACAGLGFFLDLIVAAVSRIEWVIVYLTNPIIKRVMISEG